MVCVDQDTGQRTSEPLVALSKVGQAEHCAECAAHHFSRGGALQLHLVAIGVFPPSPEDASLCCIETLCCGLVWRMQVRRFQGRTYFGQYLCHAPALSAAPYRISSGDVVVAL